MIVTNENYTLLRDQVEGRQLDALSLNETYTALCYLTHRSRNETGVDRDWTALQIGIVRRRQRELLAAKGIHVLTAT